MNSFQWLLVLGFPADVAAVSAMPDVFAAAETMTANDLAMIPERRESPAIENVILAVAA